MVRSILLVLLLGTSLARAAGAADPVTLYSPDPADPWNRLHATLFLRTAPTGETFGLDTPDPLLWSGTSHHILEDPSRAAALAALDAALVAPVPEDPLKRALLQRDLWSVFDWVAVRRTRPAAELQVRLAKVLQRVALTADEIRALPDPYAATAASRRFPAADDPAHPDTSFLPPDLFDPAGPWIPLRPTGGQNDDGTIVPEHAAYFGDRSAFEVFFRHPDGRQAALDYLARLAAATRTLPNGGLPPLPAGATFALVRRTLLFDRAGQLHPTRLVESVQLRVYRHNDAATDDRPAQSFHEFAFSRVALLADPARALHPLARDEEGFPFVVFRSMGYDHFEGTSAAERSGPPKYTKVVLRTCHECHGFPGILSVNSFSRMLGHPATPHPALAESPPDLQSTLTIRRKQSRPEWNLLRDLVTP